jgi:hypothetical protein
MSKRIWIKKHRSFEEAQASDLAYYLSLSRSERLETVQFLREEYRKMKKGDQYESGKRLRRVFKIIKQT